MIRSFRDKEAKRLFYRERSRKLPRNLLRSPPGNRLEKLFGDRADQHSIRINAKWRICFRWVDGGAEEVEIVDYHS